MESNALSVAVSGCIKMDSAIHHLENDFSATYAENVPIDFHVGNSFTCILSFFLFQQVPDSLTPTLGGRSCFYFLQSRVYDLFLVQKEALKRQS